MSKTQKVYRFPFVWRRDIQEVYGELFGQALAKYNAKQKISDCKITDYYKHIEKNGRLKPFYEVVVQFGDIETCGQKSDKWEQEKLLRAAFDHRRVWVHQQEADVRQSRGTEKPLTTQRR